jgi:hypothetical protein
VSEPLGVPEIEELIGAYALDAVEPDERLAIEAHLAECPRCRAELAEHLEVASYLSYSGAPAPDAVWGRIASALEEEPPAMRLQVVGAPAAPLTPAANRRHRPVLWALAAAAALLVVAMGAGLVHQRSQIDGLHHNLAADLLTHSANQAMADPTNQHLVLRSPTGQDVTATAVITSSGTGYLKTDTLPTLAADRTYQLWGVSGTKVISLGLLGSSPHVVAFSAHGSYQGLAVTEEVAGGVTTSSQAPVLASHTI